MKDLYWNPYPSKVLPDFGDKVVTVEKSNGERFVSVACYYPECPPENRFERPWGDGDVVAWMPLPTISDVIPPYYEN